MPTLDWNHTLIPSTVLRFDNGLTLAAHRETRSSGITIYVAYPVGSRDEPAGKFGLAHLCEHLMYCGTDASPRSYFFELESRGATSINAFVHEDYTAYFQTVPKIEFESILSMEADRMAHVPGSITRAKIDRQREIIRQELLQKETAPYAVADRARAAAALPAAHPYAHPPDGIKEQLDGISESDVARWFERYYTSADAAIIMAGNIEPNDALKTASLHFDNIPAISVSRDSVDYATLCSRASRIQALYASASILYLEWIGPSYSSSDFSDLCAACEFVGNGAGSSLWKHLGSDRGLASSVHVSVYPRQYGSRVSLEICLHDPTAFDDVVNAVAMELRRLSVDGITDPELESLRFRLFARCARATEPLSGRDGRANAFAAGLLLAGDVDKHNRDINRIAELRAGEIRSAITRWLLPAPSTIEVRRSL